MVTLLTTTLSAAFCTTCFQNINAFAVGIKGTRTRFARFSHDSSFRPGRQRRSNVAASKSPSKSGSELHTPVLLNEVLDVFKDHPLQIFIDGTLGLSGHSSAILKMHGATLKQHLGIDQDERALALSTERLSSLNTSCKLHLLHGNFGDMQRLALKAGLGLGTVDGILLDIGTSSMQLDEAARGFSFMRDGPLDMRMDTSSPLTAATIINEWSEEDISKILWEFGEERRSRLLARRIVERRVAGPVATTLQLANIIGRFNPRKPGIHPATQTFQALRIAVNRELQVLSHSLPQALRLLAPGGLLAVISFHSLEDRIVKRAFREAADASPGGRRGHRNKYARDAEWEDSAEDRGKESEAADGDEDMETGSHDAGQGPNDVAGPRSESPRGPVASGGTESESEAAAAASVAAVVAEVGARFEVLTKRPVTAGPAELAENPRARSAKLRVLRRLR